MNENGHNQYQEETQDHIMPQHDHRPHWKRIHHTWSFWIFLFLMFVAILYYIISIDFAFAPQQQVKQPSENNRTP
jgi:flagellar biosynthesis/type III secretory pathway M-ring protein FliF/YscJ